MGEGHAQGIPEEQSTELNRAIAEQLDRVVRSTTFRQSDQLKRLLEFVVQETIEGRGGKLKEYTIGLRVFKKHMSFNPQSDPIVRVQARRLRAMLEQYYSESGQQDALIIELPRGGYTPVFRQRTGSEPSVAVTSQLLPRIGNLAAQHLCSEGRYHLGQRTEESLRKALELFEKAIAEDGQFAPAQSGLSDAYTLLGHYGVLSPADVGTKATSLATAAVTLDEHSAETRTSLAHAKALHERDWSGAELDFQRAIVLNPNYATAHHWYATSCLAPRGRLDEALGEMRIAQRIDPVSSIIACDLAVMFFYRREMGAALDQCDQTIELNPSFAPAYWTLGCIQEQRGDLDESAAAFQRAEELSPKAPRMLAAIGRTLALSGRRNRALEIFRELEVIAKERYVSPLEFAWIHFALDDIDSGFQRLTQAFDDRSYDLLSLNVDPRWDSWREDSRFRVLVDGLGVGREK